MHTPITSRGHQRGAALLTAMIIVTLVATLASAMVWQQWRAVQVEAAERARVQAAWILSGALDFAKLILREDEKNTNRTGGPTALTEPWATPLAESRLSTFLAADKANADDGPEAFLSGNIEDAQARYNLNNLLGRAQDGKPDPAEVAVLERLCQAVGIESSVAQRIASGLSDAKAGGASAPLQPRTVAQLTWLGIDQASVAALTPYVVLLPQVQAINVNTASAEVLTAVVKGLDSATAERLVQIRQRTPFRDVKAFSDQISPLPSGNVDVRSSYFDVHTRLRLGDRVLIERALVHRVNSTPTVMYRERVSSLEQAGS